MIFQGCGLRRGQSRPELNPCLLRLYYQSKFATDAFNVPNGHPAVDLDVPGAQAPGYTRLDLRLDWSHIKGSPVSLGLFGLNVTNTKYIVGTDNQLNNGDVFR